LILLLYLYITDMPVCLIRAYIMFCIYTITVMFDFNRNILNALFLSAVVIFLIYPYELFSIGFQLSFGACFGIIVFYGIFKRIFSYLPGIIGNSISVTLAAQSVVFPVIYYHLKIVNITGIISNIIIIPLMSLTLVSSIIINFLSVISFNIAKMLAPVTDISVSGNILLAAILSKINGHYYTTDYKYILIPVFLLFILPVIFYKKNRYLLSGILLISFFLSWLIAGAPGIFNNKIFIFDKDSSRTVLVKNSSQKIVLGKINNRSTANKIVDQINRYKFRDIDLFIPEPDFKNLNNYSYIIRNSIVSNCYISDDYYFSKAFSKFCGLLDVDKVKLQVIPFTKLDKTFSKDNFKDIRQIFEKPAGHINEINVLLDSDNLKSEKMNEIIDEFDVSQL
jgi:ComEC/Rec2-related protein